MKTLVFCIGLLSALSGLAQAQVSVSIGAGGVQVSTGEETGVQEDVQIQGVAVINGAVYIDGDKVPKGQRTYTSKKTGKRYEINWGRDGNVAVRQLN